MKLGCGGKNWGINWFLATQCKDAAKESISEQKRHRWRTWFKEPTYREKWWSRCSRVRTMVRHDMGGTTSRAHPRRAPKTEPAISAWTHDKDEDCLQTNQCSVLVKQKRKRSPSDLYIWTEAAVQAGAEPNGLIPLQSVGWKQCIRWATRPPKPVHNGRLGLRIVRRPSPLVRLYEAFAKKTHVRFNRSTKLELMWNIYLSTVGT
jgi:hypothetical protein